MPTSGDLRGRPNRGFSPRAGAIIEFIALAGGLSRSRRHAITHALSSLACDAFFLFDPSTQCRKADLPKLTIVIPGWSEIVAPAPQPLPAHRSSDT